MAIENKPAVTSIAASVMSGRMPSSVSPMRELRNPAGALAMARKGKMEVTPTTWKNPCTSVTASKINGLRRLYGAARK